MNYRKDKYGNNISILGYGCMRFTQTAGKVNIDKTEKEILEAIQSGVNYFDTAYIYPGSETALGEILHRNNLRDSVFIATKLPHYLIRNPEKLDQYFNEELKRLKTDHIDYYLMHMLTDVRTWARLCDMGIVDWLEKKKSSGEIRQVGFSYHGNTDMFCSLIDSYDWDFCQIQYNYMDRTSQAGVAGLKYANQKGLPVVIMEPLRGGKLVNNLPANASELFSKYHIQKKPVEWALDWLWDQEEVTCVLSGMNSLDMVKENVLSASEAHIGMLSSEDQNLLSRVVQEINAKMKVGCTGCRYCMPCPKNVDIPGTFAAYNRQTAEGKFSALAEYFMCTGVRKDYTGPANCIECGKCEQHCPQHIEIRAELKEAQKALETPIYKIARVFLPLFMKY